MESTDSIRDDDDEAAVTGEEDKGLQTGSFFIRTEGAIDIRYFSFSEETAVDVFPMNRGEIEGYISLKEPYDKAGAYGIQGAFSIFIRGIRGDYNNVACRRRACITNWRHMICCEAFTPLVEAVTLPWQFTVTSFCR